MSATKKIALSIAAGVAVLGAAAPAYAVIKEVGGGTWDYGTNNTTVWSYYYHGSVCHGSSVETHVIKRSPNTAGGAWARVTDRDRPLAVDKSYWRHC